MFDLEYSALIARRRTVWAWRSCIDARFGRLQRAISTYKLTISSALEYISDLLKTVQRLIKVML